MKSPRHSTMLAVTAVISGAALVTALSKNLHAGAGHYGPGHYDGYRTYGYDPRLQPPAPPAYQYYQPGMPYGMRGYRYPAHTQAAPARPGATATPASSGNDSDENTVTIAGMQFTPATLRVAPGDEVTWTNNASMPHTVTGTNVGGLTSGRMGNGSVFTHTFEEPGTYEYYCALHPSMTGTVVVE